MKNIQISERIAKVIARGSKYSRRDAEKLILDGRVKIDDQIILQPNINVTSSNSIKLDNKNIKFEQELVLYKYYKPRGVWLHIMIQRIEKLFLTIYLNNLKR